jgi:hypothetical protein
VRSNLRFLGDSVEGTLKVSWLTTVVDELWSLTRDGRWHTRRALTRESSFNPQVVNAALAFLAKYGFIESSGEAEMRIRGSEGPSPNEVAKALSVLAFDNERRSIYA